MDKRDIFMVYYITKFSFFTIEMFYAVNSEPLGFVSVQTLGMLLNTEITTHGQT